MCENSFLCDLSAVPKQKNIHIKEIQRMEVTGKGKQILACTMCSECPTIYSLFHA